MHDSVTSVNAIPILSGKLQSTTEEILCYVLMLQKEMGLDPVLQLVSEREPILESYLTAEQHRQLPACTGRLQTWQLATRVLMTSHACPPSPSRTLPLQPLQVV